MRPKENGRISPIFGGLWTENRLLSNGRHSDFPAGFRMTAKRSSDIRTRGVTRVDMVGSRSMFKLGSDFARFLTTRELFSIDSFVE